MDAIGQDEVESRFDYWRNQPHWFCAGWRFKPRNVCKCFVSGHDFSRANKKLANIKGFSPYAGDIQRECSFGFYF